MKFYARCGKRILDVIVCIVFLVLFGWILIVISLIYWTSGQSPVFFSQRRLGYHLQEFSMYKFRTLHPEVSWTLQKRRFKLGDFMRWTNLDELPQIWNVLKGEMSWVGPRPLPIDYASFFKDSHRQRFSVRPGITGWAQIHGKNQLSWSEKFAYDAVYVQTVSLTRDLDILLRSVWLVLSLPKDVSLDEKPLQP